MFCNWAPWSGASASAKRLLMKVNDPERRLVAERVEAEPKFLHARLVPYAGGSKPIGLYRIEVEIPTDAPSCAFTGAHCGVIRLRTDHPRLPVIELKVDFVLAPGARAPATSPPASPPFPPAGQILTRARSNTSPKAPSEGRRLPIPRLRFGASV